MLMKKLVSWIIEHMRKENWFSHFIMFLTTVVGILIALELDQWREDNSEAAKAELYRLRLNNELKMNKAQVISNKLAALRAYTVIEISRSYSATDQGDYFIPKQLVDSLLTLDVGFKDLITIKAIDKDMLFVEFSFSVTDNTLNFDTWEATKASNVLQSLMPLEVFHYSSAYKALNSNLGGSPKEFLKMVGDMMNDNELSDNERIELLQALRRLIMDSYEKEQAVSQCLREVALIGKDGDIIEELTEPNDSTLLSGRVESILAEF